MEWWNSYGKNSACHLTTLGLVIYSLASSQPCVKHHQHSEMKTTIRPSQPELDCIALHETLQCDYCKPGHPDKVYLAGVVRVRSTPTRYYKNSSIEHFHSDKITFLVFLLPSEALLASKVNEVKPGQTRI